MKLSDRPRLIKLAFWSCSLLTCVIIYFLLAPLSYELKTLLIPKKLSNIENVRNYYSVLSSFTTVIVGIVGLWLGAFYFFKRMAYDEDTKKRELKKQKLDRLIYDLEKYDDCVHQILSQFIQNQENLDYLRKNKNARFEAICNILENHSDIGITDEGCDTILRVNSFVDKSDQISHLKFKDLDKDELFQESETYVELMKDAKRVCYLNIIFKS